MGIEAIAAAAAQLVGGAAGAGAGATGMHVVQLGPVGQTGAAAPTADARFQASLDRAGGARPVGDIPAGVKSVFNALDGINIHAKSVSDYAATAEASGGQLTPGEIVQLTMQCQQFMFECQLTSNIANRSSDGVQQLFKQQG